MKWILERLDWLVKISNYPPNNCLGKEKKKHQEACLIRKGQSALTRKGTLDHRTPAIMNRALEEVWRLVIVCLLLCMRIFLVDIPSQQLKC